MQAKLEEMEEDDCVDFDDQLESSTLATVNEGYERDGYYRCASRHPLRSSSQRGQKPTS